MKAKIRLLKPLTRSVGVPVNVPSWTEVQIGGRTTVPGVARAGTFEETVPANSVLEVEMEETDSESPNFLINGWPVTSGLKNGVDYDLMPEC